MERFGLDWDTVHSINPKLVMVRMPAFGLDGPWRDRAGFAMTVEQAGGLAWITGYRDQPLVIRGACDPLGGMHAVFALLGALEHRRRTGEGQLVEVPLVEVAINLAAEQVIEHSAYGVLLTRDENRGPTAAPQGVYTSDDPDELIALAIETDAQWQALVRMMGEPAWATDDALSSAAGRRAAHDEIDARVERWLSSRSAVASVEALSNAGIPAAEVVNAHDVFPDPQLEHRRFFQVMEHPETGTTRYPGVPMTFSGLDRALHQRTPPTLGQHNDEILCERLGLSPADVARLREAGVIGERPSFM
jgi:crotonobetainyl-CoA:carnitine CoA-transferase CaiB-like acyl-CoA transferase